MADNPFIEIMRRMAIGQTPFTSGNLSRNAPVGSMGEAIGSSGQGLGARPDGTQKGGGFFGVLKRPGGGVSTELSIGFEIDGREILMPALVPTLNKSEVESLLRGGPITKEIEQKAFDHGIERIKRGMSPFIMPGEKITPLRKVR